MSKSEAVNKRCLIIANGKPPAKRVISYFVKAGFSFIICADGGANIAYKKNIIPDLIIGDLDSINKSVLKHYKNKIEIIHYSRQNDTDVEKALKYCIKKGYKEAVLCGGTGDRLDHTFCNIGVALKFSDKIKVFIHHDNSLMYSLTGDSIVESKPGETISLYGIDDKTKFSSIGLKYPLKRVALPFGLKESTSNIAVGTKVHISVVSGKGLIVRDFNTVMNHGQLFNS